MKTQFVIFNFLFIIIWACSPTDSVFKDQEITLEVDAEVIENWITLRAEPVKTTFIYTVKRDTAIIFEGQLGQNWTKIESGTEININDIWGSVAENAGKPYILLPLSFKWDLGDKILLQLKPDNTTTEENWPFSDRRLNSVWFEDQVRVFVCGAGVFTRNRLNQWKEYTELPLIYTDRIDRQRVSFFVYSAIDRSHNYTTSQVDRRSNASHPYVYGAGG